MNTLRRFVLFLLLAGVLSLAGGDASADVSARFARLTTLRHDVEAARGPASYVALRKLWQEWDQGDPTEVEEALTGIVQDARISPPVRAYAGLLEAYARRRRGDLDGARKRVAALGFVSHWLVVGAFDNEGKSGLTREYGPEKGPPRLDQTFEGKERSVRWRVSQATAPYGWLDVGGLVEPTEKSCAYAFAWVHDDKLAKGASRRASIWAGSAGAMRVWFNGRLVLEDEKYRSLDADRFAATVTLESGANQLLVKACGDEDGPVIQVRLADERGAPDARLQADAPAAEPPNVVTKKGAPIPNTLAGPLQAFERAGKDPATLEAFARYLVLTASDDPSEHRARELARKAADAAPTIPRLLLAGNLAENRNQRAIWIEKAEALRPANDAEKMEVLLARAAHARSGANWRDAIPLYERALALDPDDVTAVLERYELYIEASLRETGTAFLERALTRRPRSVALVRAMAGALRQQDRTTEAAEVEERYAQLRFDDATFARGHVDLAIAQRDTETAIRWIERLLAMNPDSSSHLSQAGQSYLLLGDRARAVTMLRRWLEMSPDDTEAMRALADAYALSGKRDDQIRLMRQILVNKPQSKDVREYLAHLEPQKPKPDEVYARPSSEFLAKRGATAGGYNQRTLVNLTVTTVFPNGLASRFHQVVFQPMTDAAAAEAREYAFGYEADSEIVQLRGARVYRADGRVDEAIESGDGPANNPALATYTSARAYYVHFPRLQPGDVVELQYRVEDVAARNAFADYFGEVEYLQSAEPIARAEYVLITPRTREFFFNKPNVPGLKQGVTETGDTRTYHFVATDVPAVQSEALMPPYGELLGHVHVSTYRTWDDMGRWYWGLVRDQFVADDEVRRRVAEVTRGKTSELEKVRAVYDYVVQKTRYVALEFGIHGFKPYRCAQIFARGFGDCKDKATLIVTMLKELGIPATIVIVRTGMKGDFETYPASLAPFDHAIAYVPSLDIYLDGTAEYTGSGELPPFDRGALAIQINEGRPKLVHLPDPPASTSAVSRKLEATLAPDGSAAIEWKAEITGASAASWRQRYHAEATRKQRVLEDLASEFAGIEVSQVDAGNFEDIERPVDLRVKARVPQLARREGDRLTVPVGPGDHMVRDYAALSARRLDVRIRAQSMNDSDWTIKLPPGTRVVSPPSPSEGKSPFGSWRVEVDAPATAAAIHVKTNVTMTKTRITASEYPAFRAWCESVDRALGQRAVVGGAK